LAALPAADGCLMPHPPAAGRRQQLAAAQRFGALGLDPVESGTILSSTETMSTLFL